MDQLTLLLAASTCRLSDVMKLVNEQEALIDILHAQGRPTAGAEALLEIFKEAAAAIADQRQRLEDQMVILAQKTPQQADGSPSAMVRWVALLRRAFAALSFGGTRNPR
jgi:hypothetical protein